MKTSIEPVATPGKASGKVICQKVRDGRCTKIGGRLQQPLVELFQRHIDRRHHQRQEAIDGADQNRSRRVRAGAHR